MEGPSPSGAPIGGAIKLAATTTISMMTLAVSGCNEFLFLGWPDRGEEH